MGGEEPEEEEDADEILEMLFDQAYEMGCCIRDNIIPCACAVVLSLHDFYVDFSSIFSGATTATSFFTKSH